MFVVKQMTLQTTYLWLPWCLRMMAIIGYLILKIRSTRGNWAQLCYIVKYVNVDLTLITTCPFWFIVLHSIAMNFFRVNRFNIYFIDFNNIFIFSQNAAGELVRQRCVHPITTAMTAIVRLRGYICATRTTNAQGFVQPDCSKRTLLFQV